MGKQVTRRRPSIHNKQMDVKREEYPKCATPGCRNIVALSSKYKTCSLCRN